MKTLYTYGYGARGAQLADLQPRQGETFLVMDVRLSPASYRPEWRQAFLANALGGSYCHEPALGNLNYRGGGPIALKDERAGLAHLAERLEVGPVVLLCACPDARCCHRGVIAEKMLRRLRSLEVIHLSPGQRVGEAVGP